MERRKFIKTSCIACLGGFSIAALAESCSVTKQYNATLNNGSLLVPLNQFANADKSFKQYIVVHNDQLKYPICIYRFSDTEYKALWMSCPHQGAELQVFGSKLQCPAHGSEFDNTGKVTNAPATENLRSFPVNIENNNLKILLK